jgi:hypothetical protein
VTTHHYKLNPDEIITDIKKQQDRVKKRKPYLVGEFGFLGTNAIIKVADYIIDSEIIGGLIWSLRFHREEGGFYWHSEPLGGGIFKAFHYPGFPSGIEYNEEVLMPLYRGKAFEIRNLPVPDVKAPKPPKLLPVEKVSEISWQGSVGARYYDVERAESEDGPWKLVGYNVTDSEQIYTPLFNDSSVEVGKEYFYRVTAKNEAGNSAPSNVEGPIKAATRTLIDDMKNFTVLYYKEGDIKIVTDRDREFKEITHRFEAQPKCTLYYYVPGGIADFRINSFSQKDESSLKIELTDAPGYRVGMRINRESYYAGKGDYNYWIPSQYELGAEFQSKKFNYLIIFVQEINQIARVEIDYIPKD